jgi:hypothetical protein
VELALGEMIALVDVGEVELALDELVVLVDEMEGLVLVW